MPPYLFCLTQWICRNLVLLFRINIYSSEAQDPGFWWQQPDGRGKVIVTTDLGQDWPSCRKWCCPVTGQDWSSNLFPRTRVHSLLLKTSISLAKDVQENTKKENLSLKPSVYQPSESVIINEPAFQGVLITIKSKLLNTSSCSRNCLNMHPCWLHTQTPVSSYAPQSPTIRPPAGPGCAQFPPDPRHVNISPGAPAGRPLQRPVRGLSRDIRCPGVPPRAVLWQVL